ncbi:hypothetical protein HF086_005419 [Spodoptera exigua]|uniref:Uncharacterized protein n=1 Tax=Spodoptera exigua TaxID=7107 RepID=A0A922SDK3_SPOEX|nr:hypothetical protein HF086_005419 [Spodoptera exigua]
MLGGVLPLRDDQPGGGLLHPGSRYFRETGSSARKRGEAEHISDPQQHDAEHLDDDSHGATLQPDQLDLRGRRHAQVLYEYYMYNVSCGYWQDFENAILLEMKVRGWDGNESTDHIQWTFTGALFYSIIVITTIGESVISQFH